MLHFPLSGAGAGIHADNLARGLVRRGHTVSALCADHAVPVKDYVVDAVLFANGTNATFDLDFDIPVFASHPASRGCTFGALPETQLARYVVVMDAKIRRTLEREQPDLVHVHHGWIMASLLADLAVPYVVSLHGTESTAFDRFPRYRERVLKGLHSARCVIVLSEEERRRALARYALPAGRVLVVPGGTDTERFKPLAVDKAAVLRAVGVDDVARPVVLFAGRLIAIKGVDTLIRAASRYALSAAVPVTLIAGEGECRAAYEQLAAELGVENVHWIGFQPHARMVQLYNIADVVVVPSRVDTFPLVALEALACGTPVVASRVGGLRQIVDPSLGRLVAPDDDAAFASAIEEMIAIGFKALIRDHAAAYVRARYSTASAVRRIEGVYAAVPKGGGLAPREP